MTRWHDDLRHAADHLLDSGASVIHVLAIRSGALLLDANLIGDGARGRLALWQPVLTGKQVVTQWTRLATAGDVVAGADRGGEQRVRQLLDAQGYCEIAGYDVSRELVAGLRRSSSGRRSSGRGATSRGSRSSATARPA